MRNYKIPALLHLFYLLHTRRMLVAFFLVLSHNTYSQVINSAKCDSTDRFPITQYVSILKTEELIGLDSALILNAQNQFTRAPNKPVLVLDYDPYYYWFRIIIKNKATYPRDLMLLMAPVGMRDGRLYQRLGNNWEVIGKSGIKYKFKQRPYQFAHNVFPFMLPANTLDTLFLRVDARNVYKSFGFALIKPRDLKVFENKIYFVFGIIVGLLSLFFVLNVYLYFVLKVKVHLWYALYIAFLFLIVMKNDHLDQQFLHWDSELAYQLTPYMAIGAVAIAILMHVVQLFLSGYVKRKTFLFNISLAVKVNVLLSGLAHFITFNLDSYYLSLSIAFNWAKYSTLLAIAMILIECIYSVTKGFKSAYFILAGQAVFLIGVVQRLFFPSTLSFLFPPTTFHVGMILETAIISLGLVYQYYWIEKEQNRQRENNFRKELHKTELEIQEQTMKNISEEIHDNVGQVLTLAKLNMKTIDCNDPKSLQEKVNSSSELIGKAIQDLRNLSKNLNVDYVTEMGLVNLIEYELERIKKIGKHQTIFIQEGDPYTIAHQQFLFRIFQELLNNVIKHSEASLITVRVLFHPEKFELQILDDGKGFDFSSIYRNNQAGLGIRNIRHRVQIIGGQCKFVSAPGEGTAVNVTLPISA